MENKFDIFNLSLEDFKTEEKPKSGQDLYKTDPKLSKDSIYRAIVRFIPNVKNPKKSFVKKFSYWLEDAGGNGFYVDCPSSIGDKSIIQDTFWKLYKSESAFDKKQAEKIKRKEYYYSLVYIMKDPQRPEYENTVQILRYPRAVKKLIDSQIQPDVTDLEMGTEPTNVFDFFEGKDFSLKVTMKGGYWNYDECKFAQAKTPITVNAVKMENNSESRKMIMDLYEGAADIEIYDFKQWDEDLRNKVNNVLGEITGNPGAAYNAVTSPAKTASDPQRTESAPKMEESLPTPPNPDANENIEDWLKEFDIK